MYFSFVVSFAYIMRWSTGHSKMFSGECVNQGASQKRYSNDCQTLTYKGDITAMFITSHDLPYVTQDSMIALLPGNVRWDRLQNTFTLYMQ